MVLRFRADMSRFQLSFPFRSLRLRTWCIISLPVAPHNSHFFRFEPVCQIGSAHVCDRVRFDVAASVERRCPAFETRLVKGSGLDYPFLLVLYGEQFAETVLFVDFSYRAPIFARKCFIHAVLHDISEVVQYDAVVGDQVIVAESHCFPIVSVEDFEVVVEYQA